MHSFLDALLGAAMPEAEGSGRTPQGVPYSELPHIINADGLHLFCRYWEPEGPPKALVFVVHGAGEHCSAYADVAHTLTQHSLFVFAHDHVGHGQSEGERMNIKNFQIYIRDCLQHIDLIRTRYPNLPIFLLGHSMGGAISILTACEKPQDFAGVVLIAPMIQMNPESATPFKVQAYESDELVYHGGMRVSFGMQLMAASSRIETELPNISWPFLLLHGTADKLCDIRGSHLMYNQAKSTDKKLKVYDGAYHALHHELPETAESVLQEVITWIIERLPAPSGP
ncbi:monoglyceride lipase isoform X3 [Ictalurus furcatus]|uniref:monoglyceride lipase isoform X3 n=1 Tax=Ictalurus furcatus TaxID=66913 RepID=UPI0023506B9D|nr:monoglyceride lipase isoform X3 [Ictalurus furcatus]